MHFPKLASVLLASAVLLGCGDKPSKPAEKPHEEHKAPHGGEILELGAEEAHLEMIHDAATGSLTLYVLDKDVKTPIATEAPVVTVKGKDGNVTVPMTAVTAGAGGQADSWKGAHDALKTDPVDGRIRVTIRGKSYQTPVEPEGHKH